MNILNKIQKELKAPKNQYNAFGKYKYRSCEDILEAVKPLLEDATLTINDEMVVIGERYYIKATVTLKQGEEEVSTTAYARESEEKKGMDSAQITGATSSYARKYALNGLFLIDDTKDADTMDNSKVEAKPTQPKKAKTPDEILKGIYKINDLELLEEWEKGLKSSTAYLPVEKSKFQNAIDEKKKELTPKKTEVETESPELK